jgi:ATP phosphoribosyltransferase
MAVPKKGRLYEKVVKVLEGAGLEYRRVRATQLSTSMAE